MATSNLSSSSPQIKPGAPSGAKAKVFLVLLCLVVIAAGALGASMIVRSAPKPKRRPPVKMIPLVRVQEVQPTPETVIVEAMGSVVPARKLTLKSRVNGEIVKVHPEFMKGGIVRSGDQVLKIDDKDYALIITRKQSTLTNAHYALKLELGRQDIALREWELLNGNNPALEGDTELALRKPHLEKARSDLTAAEAELTAARLQLARTHIKVPFNAVILETHVDIGSQVTAQEKLATLVGTDEYWVQVSVPVDRLGWIDIPNSRRHLGAPVKIIYRGNIERHGKVLKLLSDLESNGRMARLLISIKDPLSLTAKDTAPAAMLIGEYVKVQVQGRRIASAYRISRSALRDNAHIWLADKDGKLEIRKIDPFWRDRHSVLLKEGLKPGERLIVSDMAAPVPGMSVRVENNNQPPLKPAFAKPLRTSKNKMD